MSVSRHTAPQLCGSCHEHRHTDRLGRCSFDPSYIPRTKPGSCRMQVYSTPSPPHNRSHVSLSSGFPRGLGFLGDPTSMPGIRLTTYSWAQQQLVRADLRLHRSGWPLVGHLRVVLSAGSTTGCVPRKGESVAHGTLSFLDQASQPALACRFSRRFRSTFVFLPIVTWLTGLLSRALPRPALHPWRDPCCRVSSDSMRVEPSPVHLWGGSWTFVRTHTPIQLSKAHMLPLPLIPLDHSKFRENGSQPPQNRT